MPTVHTYNKIVDNTTAGKRAIAYSGRATTGAGGLEFHSNSFFFSKVQGGMYTEVHTYECVHRHKNGEGASMKIELGLKCLDGNQELKKFLIYEGKDEEEFERSLRRALEELLD